MFNLLENIVLQASTTKAKATRTRTGAPRVSLEGLTVGKGHKFQLSDTILLDLGWVEPHHIYTNAITVPTKHASLSEDVAFNVDETSTVFYLAEGNKTPRSISNRVMDAIFNEEEKDLEEKSSRIGEEFLKRRNAYMNENFTEEEIAASTSIGNTTTVTSPGRTGFIASVDSLDKSSVASKLRDFGGEVYSVKGAKGFMIVATQDGNQVFGVVENNEKVTKVDEGTTVTYLNRYGSVVPFKELNNNDIALVQVKFLREVIERPTKASKKANVDTTVTTEA